MGIPLGLVCKKCGYVFGAIVSPKQSELPKIESVCQQCIGRLSQEKGITPNSAENWKRLLE